MKKKTALITALLLTASAVLTACAGKTVKRYTYGVLNYPGLREDIWASLLVYRHTVVGGEIFCSQGDGFTQGLAYPQGTGISDSQSQGA